MEDSKAGTGKVKGEPKQFCCAKSKICKNLGACQNNRGGKKTPQKQQVIGANLKGLPLAKSDLTIKTNSKGLSPSK